MFHIKLTINNLDSSSNFTHNKNLLPKLLIIYLKCLIMVIKSYQFNQIKIKIKYFMDLRKQIFKESNQLIKGIIKKILYLKSVQIKCKFKLNNCQCWVEVQKISKIFLKDLHQIMMQKGFNQFTISKIMLGNLIKLESHASLHNQKKEIFKQSISKIMIIYKNNHKITNQLKKNG